MRDAAPHRGAALPPPHIGGGQYKCNGERPGVGEGQASFESPPCVYSYVGLMPVILQTVLPSGGVTPVADVAPVRQLETTAVK